MHHFLNEFHLIFKLRRDFIQKPYTKIYQISRITQKGKDTRYILCNFPLENQESQQTGLQKEQTPLAAFLSALSFTTESTEKGVSAAVVHISVRNLTVGLGESLEWQKTWKLKEISQNRSILMSFDRMPQGQGAPNTPHWYSHIKPWDDLSGEQRTHSTQNQWNLLITSFSIWVLDSETYLRSKSFLKPN